MRESTLIRELSDIAKHSGFPLDGLDHNGEE